MKKRIIFKQFSIPKRIVILSLGVAFLLLIVVVFLSMNYSNDKITRVENIICDSTLKSGDLVFRKGRSAVSQVVLLADKESSYSHVGIVFIENNNYYIIHTTPDESESGIDYVIKEKVSDFFSSEKASRGSVYRLKKQFANSANSASLFANTFFEKRIIFDDEFDLESEDKMYCTELVWKAYQKVGIDLIQGNFETISLPFINDFIVMPSSLLNSDYLEEIYFY